MRIEYLHIPELADKRHIIVDGRRTVNTAAKQSKVIYLLDRGRILPPEEADDREQLKAKAPH